MTSTTHFPLIKTLQRVLHCLIKTLLFAVIKYIMYICTSKNEVQLWHVLGSLQKLTLASSWSSINNSLSFKACFMFQRHDVLNSSTLWKKTDFPSSFGGCNYVLPKPKPSYVHEYFSPTPENDFVTCCNIVVQCGQWLPVELCRDGGPLRMKQALFFAIRGQISAD